MTQKYKAGAGRAERGGILDDLSKKEDREKNVACGYNEAGSLSGFLRKYKPFEDGNPVVKDLMKFYDVKLGYAMDLMGRKAAGKGGDVYSRSLHMLRKDGTPQTVNAVSYIAKIELGKSDDPMDSEIVLALEACRDTFNYINERTRK